MGREDLSSSRSHPGLALFSTLWEPPDVLSLFYQLVSQIWQLLNFRVLR